MLPFTVICVIAVVLTMVLSRGKVLRGIIWGFVIAPLLGLTASLDMARSDGLGAADFALFLACYGAWLGGGIHAYRLRARPAAYVSLSCFAAFVVFGLSLWD